MILITIHYQNVGETLIQNLRIVDNLAARFEFVPDSNESSRRALFARSDNSVGSVKLKWEVQKHSNHRTKGKFTFAAESGSRNLSRNDGSNGNNRIQSLAFIAC